MDPAAPSPASPLPPPRSTFVTVLAWLVIVGSALATPISVISFLMFLVGSHGTASGTLFGWITVVGGPPVTLLAGIGLLRRKGWARLYLLAMLCAVLAYNVAGILKGPTQQTTHFSADGVPTTILASSGSYSFPILALSIGLLAMLLSPKVCSEFGPTLPISMKWPRSEKSRGWRVGHRGRDFMYYQEWREGGWQHIDIDGEMLMGRAHHVIYFRSPEHWQSYPEWARHRRDEIIARIKSEFREPDYEYDDGSPKAPFAQPLQFPPGPAAAIPSTNRPASRPYTSPLQKTPRWQTWLVSLLVVAALLGLAGWMGCLVKDGIEKGETPFPTKRASQRRNVTRLYEPVEFWMAIGLYGLIGIGSFGLVVWGVRVCWSPGKIDGSAK